jgi:hypothetical protein
MAPRTVKSSNFPSQISGASKELIDWDGGGFGFSLPAPITMALGVPTKSFSVAAVEAKFLGVGGKGDFSYDPSTETIKLTGELGC